MFENSPPHHHHARAQAEDSEERPAEDVIPADDGSAKKQFAGFLSHYKHECGTEARLVQVQLREILPRGHNKLFIDSDDLNDLRLLLQHVKDTEALVLLQSKGVLTVGSTHDKNTHPEINKSNPRTRPHTPASTHALAQPAHPHHTHAQRPWVILELYTALTNHIPVVALNVNNAFAYDYGTPHKIRVKFPIITKEQPAFHEK